MNKDYTGRSGAVAHGVSDSLRAEERASFSGTTHADKTGGGKLWMNTDHPQAARNCYFVSSCKDVRNMGDEQLNSALSYAEDHHIRGSIPDALKAEYQARATGKSHADLPMARGGYESPVYQP